MLLWIETWWELALAIAVLLTTASTVVLLTLPSEYSPFAPDEVTEADFTDQDREDPARSGYDYFKKHSSPEAKLFCDVTVQIVVLGDIGRSPRMQYHALSIAAHGGAVNIVGYVESEVHSGILAHRMIEVTPIQPFPKRFQTSNKALFLLVAPLKVLWQIWSLYHALGYRTKASKWMLVQNPPSIPTLIVAQFICFVRHTRLIVDWHNFGYSLLALHLGARHPLVRLSQWYEGFCSKGATAHFAVTDAMTRVLKEKWGVEATPLHDRPSRQFQPLSKEQQSMTLRKLPSTASWAHKLEAGEWKLLVSSTSWTADEDFCVLLDALVRYSAAVEDDSNLPGALVIITGKGPLKDFYIERIEQLNEDRELLNVHILTAWLSTEDYASLLGSAHVGISLHTSSSGVDLPMKVVDMLGTGLPVLGWSKFEAWSELVHEGENGCGFESAEDLTALLRSLFGDEGQQLRHLRQGALKDCNRRWDDEWLPVAGQLLQLNLSKD